MDSPDDFIQIFPASAEMIRSRSYGEVKNFETINERSRKCEKGGLFCERIFGPVKDYECNCGKYKRIRYKGVICDRCGVEVTLSKVRRERMGHIELIVPVSHVWFFKRFPSHLSTMLNMSVTALDEVIYYESWCVTDPGYTPLKTGQLLDDVEYAEAREDFGDSFSADMGAAAIKTLLEQLNLPLLRTELKEQINITTDKSACRRLNRRLQLIESYIDSDTRPEWMIMTVLPVLPPNLRPEIQTDDNCRLISDLNELYRRVIIRNNRLKNLLELPTPPVIIRNEKRMLQEAVDKLLDNGLYGRALTDARGNALQSLTHLLGTGREWRQQGHFGKIKKGKAVDYSAATIAVPDPDLPDDTVAIPFDKIAKTLWEPFIAAELKDKGFTFTIRGAKRMVEQNDPIVYSILEELVSEFAVFVTHPPVINDLRARFFKVVLTNDHAMHLSSNSFYDMEFDKPSPLAKIFLPLSKQAQYEAKYAVKHPLRQKKLDDSARIILQMLECDIAQPPLLCPTCEYAAMLCEINDLPVNTHIQLPEEIHTSIGGALLSLEIPDVLEPDIYPETLQEAKELLHRAKDPHSLQRLLLKYSDLIEPETHENSCFKDDYLQIYDDGLIGFQKLKFEKSLPTACLDLESVYFSCFADIAYCTYCKNKLYKVCTVKDCPAHGLSGRERCLCAKPNGQYPDHGSAIGLKAVYKLIGSLAEKDMKSAVQLICKYFQDGNRVTFNSMEELENVLYFPEYLPRKEIELLFAIKKQQDGDENQNFFYHAAKNAPKTILDAILKGQKICLDSPDAVPVTGQKPRTCAIETAIKKESWTNAFSAKDWGDLLSAYPEMDSFCKWDKFKRKDFIDLLLRTTTKEPKLKYVSLAYHSGTMHINDWIGFFDEYWDFFLNKALMVFTEYEAKQIAEGCKSKKLLRETFPLLSSTADEQDEQDELDDIFHSCFQSDFKL